MTTDQPPTKREFEVMEYCAQMLDEFDNERIQRSIISALAERYGWSLQPSTKPVKTSGARRRYKPG